MDPDVREERGRVFSLLRDQGFSAVETSPCDLDFDVVCRALSLLLLELGHVTELETAVTLGDRVRNAESVITELESLGYRRGLQAHQLTGLDWKALQHALTWTQNLVAERRELTKDVDMIRKRFKRRSREQTPVYSVSQAAQRNDEEELLLGLPITGKSGNAELSIIKERISGKLQEVSDAEAHLMQVSKLLGALQLQETQLFDVSNADVQRLQELILENEDVKVAEKEFKKGCRMERDRLSQTINSMNLETVGLATDITEFDSMRKQLLPSLSKARVALAAVSREESTLSRMEDEKPSQEELVEYERRFGELYELMTLKSDEHKRHLATLNFSRLSLKLLADHLSLLRSLRDGFEASKNSLNVSKEYYAQFPATLSEFRKVLSRSRENVHSARKSRDEAGAELTDLLAKQRRFYRAIKELQEAFGEQERLIGS